MMQSHDVEMTEIFWGDHVLQLLSSGRVEDALRFISENEALLNVWQHGFCSKIFSSVPPEHCKNLVLKLATQCPVDDAVFDLIEVANDLDTKIFFDTILPSYLVLLSRDANQKYLDWYIAMVKTRLIMLSSADMEMKQSYIKISFDEIETAAKFFHPFTLKVRCLLASELLSYFVMDEDMKNHAVRILSNFLPDPFFLASYIESGLNADKHTQKYNPILDSSVVSLRAVCLYFGFRVLNCDFPLIYSPRYLLVSSLPILHQLLMNDSDELINLGLEIFAHFSGNEVSFGVHDLTPDFAKCMSALNNVMIYNQTKERRDGAFRMFNFLRSSLDDKGLYQMLLNYRNQVNHPSTISYLMSQIKRSFMDPNNEYFKGKRLFDILKLYASIDKGINLLDEHVRIVTTLNFFWYLIGCHKRKSIQLDESFLKFMHFYGDTVEELIAKARLEQQASLRELQRDNDCNLSVTMYHKSLPELSNQQKMDSILSVRNVIDVVEHNLEAFNTYCKQFFPSGLCSGQKRRFSDGATTNKTGEQEDEYEDNIRIRILQASLPLVKDYGWSQQTIAEGAKVLGYPGVTSGMFQSGAADLIFYFYEDCNKKLVSQMETDAALTKEKQEPREIVEAAIQTRLRMIIPYLDKWPQALGIMTLPRNVPIALSNLLTLVDDICFHAGDRSVDFNWYSRRLAVGGIYKMTELCLIQDKSDNFAVTCEFLHRRMDEAMSVHSLLQSSGDATNVARDAVLATFTTARNILRLNQTR